MNQSHERSDVTVKELGEAICPTGAIPANPTTGVRLIGEGKRISCSARVYGYPFGAAVLDRSFGKSVSCDLFHGDLKCVRFCPRDTLSNTSGAMTSVSD